MFKCYSVSFFLVFICLGFILMAACVGMFIFGSSFSIINNYFIFDSISFYLVMLILFLGVYSQLSYYFQLNTKNQAFLILSLIFSILCFCTNHSIFFWCFYELSMLPLLYLMFKESPYSERFLAGWYFSCYLLVTSLPLVLLLIYLSVINDSFLFSYWLNSGSASVWIFMILSFMFFTKVPLMPFHTWLPMVHAEATSMVSIFLSGYMMKLGLLGVYRCSYFIFGGELVLYLFVCFMIGLSFLITASGELDGKRWLAFLSLAHMMIPFFAFFMSDSHSINYSFFYCLGHGLSAGIVFGLLWYFYDLSNSRNWLLLKSSVKSKVSSLLLMVSMLSLCSFPTTMQFFCEMGLMKVSGDYLVYLLFWSVYLFLGGVVPLVLCGHLLVRGECVENYSCSMFSYFNYLCYLCFWCYLGLLFI